MNTITIPFLKGVHLSCEPGHELNLSIALSHLSSAIEQAGRNNSAPLLSQYLETILQRFLRETHYSAKSESMLKGRLKKIEGILLDGNAEKKISELSENDTRRIKLLLPDILQKNKNSQSQGTNIEAYYRLFNRIAKEAFEDRYVTDILKISATRTKKAKISKPFADTDIQSLLSGWPYQREINIRYDAYAYRFWLLPLSLYTGLRLNEACQLRLHDIIEDRHGVSLISVNDDGYQKSIKNEQSRRLIPVCNALKQMGFLDYVEERRKLSGKNELLFPELNYNTKHLYSRDPSRFYCGPSTGKGYIGSQCPHTKDGGWNFKSFRRTFAIRLEASGVPSNTIAYLLGHRSGSSEVTDKHYLSQPLSVSVLQQLESGLAYNLDLNGIHWENYQKIIFRQRHRAKRGKRLH